MPGLPALARLNRFSGSRPQGWSAGRDSRRSDADRRSTLSGVGIPGAPDSAVVHAVADALPGVGAEGDVANPPGDPRWRDPCRIDPLGAVPGFVAGRRRRPIDAVDAEIAAISRSRP